MVAFIKTYAFVEDLAEKKHDLGSDALTIALMTTANKVTTSTTDLASLTPITYTNLTANGSGTGGRTCTTSSSAQTTGTYKLVLADIIFTAGGGSANAFGSIALYNDTSTTDRVIGGWDYASDVTLANTETFTIDFDASGGVLTIA